MHAAADPARVRSGIFCTILCYFLFAFHDALVKWILMAGVSLWLVFFVRSATILVLCLLIRRGDGIRAVRETPLKAALAFRGLMILCAWLCYYSASKWLPLAELTVLYFAAPIIITILAIPVLGERITAARWAGVLVGFAGVIVACRPGRFHATHASYLVLIAAALWAAAAVLVRKVSIAAGSFLQMVYSNAVFVCATALGTVLTWQPIAPTRFGLLVVVGILGAGGQLTFFESMRRAPASLLAPFEYTALLWAFALGYLVWGDVPDAPVFMGALMIISSGIVVFVFDRSTHERKLAGA